MDVWLIGIAVGTICAYAFWSLWKTHSHPAQVLLRQAINMNWVRVGTIKKDGYRNVRLTRENEEAIICRKAGDVLLVRVHCPLTFDDFIELERWLAHEEKSAEPGDEEDVGEEILYYREIEKYIIRHGYFEPLLHTQATDEEFGIASLKIRKAGYLAGKPANLVGALILEALSRYDKNREASLEFFATNERDFQSAKQTPSQIPSSEGETSQDKAEVANLHRHADQGNADAQFFLGFIYETGDGAPQNYAKAGKWYRLAADQGHAHAQSSLGSMYLHGRGMRRDHGEAAKWYCLAAEQGYLHAQSMLGSMYFSGGPGLSKSDAEAVKWYRLAVNQGDAEAQRSLGRMYERGWGVTRDYAEAAKWYRLAAEQGNADAQLILGTMNQTGRGVPQDYAEAAKWYCLAAEQGNADAQLILGAMHDRGQGVPQDYAEAAKWYRLAAEQGNAVAQFNLGAMNHKGRGMPQHYAEAMRWYRLAAHQGNALAQLAFGLMYANGRGVPQDYIEACKWFNLSAAQGNQDAVKSLGISTSRMTPAQIAKAQKLAREWKLPKQPPSR
jgi:uncharacterized protein